MGDDEVQQEAERLWAGHLKSTGGFLDVAGRFIFRTIRIAVGVAIVAVLYSFSDRLTVITHKPFAALTIADLAQLIFYILLGLAGLSVAWWIAFGERRAPILASAFHAQARDIVDQRHREVREQERVAKYYAKSRLRGLVE